MVPRGALALGESRAAPVRSGWAGAPHRGRGNGGKVVRKRGRGMKICRVKYYVDFGGIFIEKRVVRAAAVEPPRARRYKLNFSEKVNIYIAFFSQSYRFLQVYTYGYKIIGLTH